MKGAATLSVISQLRQSPLSPSFLEKNATRDLKQNEGRERERERERERGREEGEGKEFRSSSVAPFSLCSPPTSCGSLNVFVMQGKLAPLPQLGHSLYRVGI